MAKKTEQPAVPLPEELAKEIDAARKAALADLAAARLNGTTYSKLIAGLAKNNVAIDRKIMADLAVQDPAGFTAVVAAAK